MKTFGNIFWLLFGGFLSGMGWIITGMLWCISLIGIPVGVQCFKLAEMSFWPFGKTIVYEGGAGSFLINVLWFLFGGVALALFNFICGLLWCVTLVGIPFGMQFFKLAKLSLAPFGAVIRHD